MDAQVNGLVEDMIDEDVGVSSLAVEPFLRATPVRIDKYGMSRGGLR